MAAKNKNRKPSESRRYDVEMIRDFIDHLTWEVRISAHESQASVINPELKEQLEKYIKKRQTAGLLFATFIEQRGTPDKEAEYQATKGELRKSQLLCLEALQSLFAEAYANAKEAGTFNVVKFKTVDEAIAALKQQKDFHETGEFDDLSDD